MIRTVLPLTRPLVVLDVETTGLDTRTARIIELAFQVHYHDGRDVYEWRSFINPGIPIPQESLETHGIDNERMQQCNDCGRYADTCRCVRFKPIPHFHHIAPRLAQGFRDCDYAGKQVRYDLRMIAAEMARAKITWSYADAKILDADRLEQLGDPRTLSDLYRKHLNKEPTNAHQALADVRMTTDILVAQLQKYQTLPRDLHQLHEMQWPRWIDPDGKFQFDFTGEPRFANWGKYAGKRMRDADLGYWDFILANDFSPDIKALAAAAKLGQFPVRKDPP